MSMTVSNGKSARAEINMTPMIDVLLVLIIIFMLIAPVTPLGLRAQVPQPPAPGPSEPAHEIVVTVRNDGTVLLNQEALDLARLEERLVRLYRKGPNAVLFIRGERQLQFGSIAGVIDLARGAGVDRIALMTM